ncbi:hypothetical protein VPH35_100677 [Triticum aestivum]
MSELVEDLFLRLSPELVDAPWRRILADPGFRGRYRKFHGTPPVLGLFQSDGSFFPASALPTVRGLFADRPLDCRHGRALLGAYSWPLREGYFLNLTVLDPLTGHRRCVPYPVDNDVAWFSVAVLCAAQGCDHHGCQGGHFRVTSGWLYSSETRVWSELTSLHHPNAPSYTNLAARSVLAGDALYFNIHGNGIIEFQLGALRLSKLEQPITGKGRLMTTQDGRLGFAVVVDVTNLTLWSMETGPEAAMGWAKLRVIDLKTLLPSKALSTPVPEYGINGIAEGTQVIFMNTCLGSYMVDLKSGRVRKVCGRTQNITPYQRFYIPAMEAACTGKGQ